MDVFTYGSLMFDPVWRRVVAGACPSEPARLAGWARRRVRGETYPALVPQAGGRVEGVLYRQVAPDDLARLDAFEGDDYLRRDVTVLTAAGPVTAQVYAWKAGNARLLDEDWLPTRFLEEGMARFIERYPGFLAV